MDPLDTPVPPWLPGPLVDGLMDVLDCAVLEGGFAAGAGRLVVRGRRFGFVRRIACDGVFWLVSLDAGGNLDILCVVGADGKRKRELGRSKTKV